MSRCNPFAIARQTKNDIVKGLGKVYEDLAANATDDDNNNNGKSCCSKCEACNQLRTVMKQPDANRLPGNNSGMYKCTPWGEKKIKQKEIMALGGEEGIALGAERDHIKQKYETSYPSGIEHKEEYEEEKGTSSEKLCDCPLGVGLHTHLPEDLVDKFQKIRVEKYSPDNFPPWLLHEVPDYCHTEDDVTKEISLVQFQAKPPCQYPAPCRAECTNHLPKGQWNDVVPPYRYFKQHRKTYRC